MGALFMLIKKEITILFLAVQTTLSSFGIRDEDEDIFQTVLVFKTLRLLIPVLVCLLYGLL